MIHLAIHGAAGRMGRRLIALAVADGRLSVTAAIEAPGHEQLGRDAAALAGTEPMDVPIIDQLPPDVDVVIDFSQPQGTRRALDACMQTHTALVIGTTALSDDDHHAIDQAATSIPVLQAPNMSLGINVLFALCGQVAQRLGDDYDIEIIETHHRFKKDAPSGTALGMAQAICAATGKDMHSHVRYDRHGQDVPRAGGEIMIHALRSGDVVGRHTASFATLGEELQLTHVATHRDVFARGALHAAAWIANRPAGRYTMADVLGLA